MLRLRVFFGHTCGSTKGVDRVYAMYIEQRAQLLFDVEALSPLVRSEIEAIIRCVIRGIGMSADGRGKSLGAPRPEGQVIAMRRAHSESLRPEDGGPSLLQGFQQRLRQSAETAPPRNALPA